MRLKNKLIESNIQTLEKYSEQIESAFSRVEYAMLNLMAKDNSFQGMMYPLDELETHLNINNLREKLRRWGERQELTLMTSVMRSQTFLDQYKKQKTQDGRCLCGSGENEGMFGMKAGGWGQIEAYLYGSFQRDTKEHRRYWSNILPIFAWSIAGTMNS